MLNGPSWPIFICPNCRATADLDAEVDEPSDEWQQLDSGVEDIQEDRPAGPSSQANDETGSLATSQTNSNSNLQAPSNDHDAGDMTMHMDTSPVVQSNMLRHAATEPVPIPNATPRTVSDDRSATNRTPSPNSNTLANATEGPITPRNDAGPWVFDGNPARGSQESTRQSGMGSLDAAAQGEADRS